MNKKLLIPLALFMVLAAFLFIGLSRDPREVPSPLIGQPAPAFDAPQLARPDARVSPATFRGKPWVLNVWASWCGACRDEHPVLVACHAAMFDHLSEGRFILGVSPGALPSDAEALGIFDEDRNKMFAESIDVILKIWESDPPFNIDLPDNRFKVSTMKTLDDFSHTGKMYKPYQSPRPEIVGTVVAPYSKGVIAMGEKDFHPMSANFLYDKWLQSHWDNYAQGKANVGQVASRSDWRVARTVFVADDDATAQAYGKADANSPYRYYYRQMLTKMKMSKRHVIFKRHEDEDDSLLTLERVLDDLVICGTVNQVVDQVLALREEVGDFGELVYAGMDQVDPRLSRRSMELMAHEVMPRVNEAIRQGHKINA